MKSSALRQVTTFGGADVAFLILKAVGLRVTLAKETEGLDIFLHGQRIG